MDSSFGIFPSSINFLAHASVTPPAVSVKIPSVSASKNIASTISSSVASSEYELIDFNKLIALIPSAGLPIARDFAIVFGFTGLNVSQSFFTAVEIGEHPVAWAPYILVLLEPTNPKFSNS